MWLSVLINILFVLLVPICILLVLVVLMQRPRSEGLGAAFGTGMTENIFGAQTTSVLTKATIYLGIAFFGITLLTTVLIAKQSQTRGEGVLEREARQAAGAPAPTASPAASPAASPTPAATPESAASPVGSPTPAATPESAASPAASPEAQASPTEPSAPATAEPSPTGQ
jgi:preprotein translocase subunit SecG